MPGPISLFDLRRKKTQYAVGDENFLELQGLTAREIFDHLERYPILQSVSIGGNFSLPEMLANAPRAATAWVASACGHHRSEEAEDAVAQHFTIEEVSEIVEQSMALTFSKGFGPFSARLVALMGYVTVTPGRGPGTRSEQPSPPAPQKPSTTTTTAPGTPPPDSSPQPPSSPPEPSSPTPPA